MKGKDTSKSKETNGGVLLAKEEAAQAISEKSEEQNPPNGGVLLVKEEEAQAQSNKTNGGVLLVKVDEAQAISKSTKKNPAIQSNVATKKRGALHLLRVALFMLRGRKGKTSKSVQVEVGSKGLWRKVVGSMRSLHLHDHQPEAAPEKALEPKPKLAPAPTPTPAPALAGLPSSLSVENFQEMVYSPQRPYLSPSASPSSSSGGTSRYASAQNLQELGRRAGLNCDDEIDEIEEIDEEEILNDEDEDEMIDVKAEEFIANFYEQMRLQRMDSMKCYKEMTQRGLH